MVHALINSYIFWTILDCLQLFIRTFHVNPILRSCFIANRPEHTNFEWQRLLKTSVQNLPLDN